MVQKGSNAKKESLRCTQPEIYFTKFTTRINDKTKESSVSLPRHFCASLMVENDPKKEIEALRRKDRVAKEMDQAIHEFTDSRLDRQTSESRNNGTTEDRFGTL